MRGDPETRFLYSLAATLHVPLSVVLDMPFEEIRGWDAWFATQDRK